VRALGRLDADTGASRTLYRIPPSLTHCGTKPYNPKVCLGSGVVSSASSSVTLSSRSRRPLAVIGGLGDRCAVGVVGGLAWLRFRAVGRTCQRLGRRRLRDAREPRAIDHSGRDAANDAPGRGGEDHGDRAAALAGARRIPRGGGRGVFCGFRGYRPRFTGCDSDSGLIVFRPSGRTILALTVIKADAWAGS
jgi:hypothetical protein